MNYEDASLINHEFQWYSWVFGAVNSAGTFLWMLREANSHVSMPSGGESCEEVHKTSDLIWGNFQLKFWGWYLQTILGRTFPEILLLRDMWVQEVTVGKSGIWGSIYSYLDDASLQQRVEPRPQRARKALKSCLWRILWLWNHGRKTLTTCLIKTA